MVTQRGVPESIKPSGHTQHWRSKNRPRKGLTVCEHGRLQRFGFASGLNLNLVQCIVRSGMLL